ncbi:MAG: hypothetical protein OEO84_06690 [Betaproteobacteria bacterium]|nr:hypothetical protein [Betaproteobacteria bacterium]
MTVGVVLLAAIAVTIALVLLERRRRSRIDTRIRLYEMMRLRGVSSPAPQDPDAALAERRCAACSSKELCDELLRVGRSDGYRKFCPNALYLEWLRSNSLHFD